MLKKQCFKTFEKHMLPPKMSLIVLKHELLTFVFNVYMLKNNLLFIIASKDLEGGGGRGGGRERHLKLLTS